MNRIRVVIFVNQADAETIRQSLGRWNILRFSHHTH
jgi:hypothetical protein